jgi:hypothetical protein
MNDAVNRLSRMSVGNGTFKTEMKEILQNKYVMYAILIIAILNIIGYLALRNMDAILFFILVFLLSIYFTRNMIIVLFISIVATNFYVGTVGISGMTNREGLKNSKEGNKNKNKTSETSEEDDAEEIEGNTSMNPSTDADTEPSENSAPDTESDTKPEEGAKSSTKPNTGDTGNTGATKKGKPKSGMQNLKPAKFKPSKPTGDAGDDDDDDDDEDDDGHAKISGSKGNRVDYAQTLGQAYDNLQNIIGKDGVKGLTNQTKDLMEQQKVLMNNMKDMEPIIKSAQGFMSQIMGSGGLDGISKLFDGKLFGAVAPAVAENGKSLDAKK